MSTTEMTIVFILLICIIPVEGIMAALTPWLMKGRELFAVTVPESAQADPRLRRMKTRYTLVISLFTAVLTALGVIMMCADNPDGLFGVIVIGSLLLVACSFVLMLFFRSKVMRIKQEEGWTAVVQEQVSVTLGEDAPRPLSFKWNLLYAPVILFTLVFGVATYSLMPDAVPMQVDFNGNVTTWADKSPLLILLPVLIQLFLAAVFMFSHWQILSAKKGSDPEMPVTSTLAYALFARAQSTFLVFSGVVTCALIFTLPLAQVGFIAFGQAGITFVIGIMPILIGSLAIAIVYGQSGARAITRLAQTNEMRYDDDAYWKLGIFYVNPGDVSIFVPERFGIGWTLNFGSKIAWAIIVAGGLLTVAFLVAIMAMF